MDKDKKDKKGALEKPAVITIVDDKKGALEKPAETDEDCIASLFAQFSEDDGDSEQIARDEALARTLSLQLSSEPLAPSVHQPSQKRRWPARTLSDPSRPSLVPSHSRCDDASADDDRWALFNDDSAEIAATTPRAPAATTPRAPGPCSTTTPRAPAATKPRSPVVQSPSCGPASCAVAADVRDGFFNPADAPDLRGEVLKQRSKEASKQESK